jgi:hypothetical protein
MSLPQLISQERFMTALVEGIPITQKSTTGAFNFGERMIQWINNTPNEYWACWDRSKKNQIVMDIRNIELMYILVEPDRVTFLRPPNGAAEDLPKEFGNGAIGIMLFCMMENGEIDEVPLDEVPAEEVQLPPQAKAKPTPDFDWI